MWTQEDLAIAAAHSLNPERWLAGLDEILGRVGARVTRVEPRKRLRQFVIGMMAGLPRVNCWTLAEHAGETCPRGMQRFLSEAVWDEDGLLEDARDLTISNLGELEAVLVIDETGDLKKGSLTVGTQRQYTGTAGRIENAQVAVYLTYASRYGHALMDRALYLPESWTGDPERLAGAGVPDDVVFATKPALAGKMIAEAIAIGTPAAWAAGDEVYGADSKLRHELHTLGLGYVLAVAKNHQIVTEIGARRAIELAVRLPAHAWHWLSAGRGAKGERWYDWALVETTDPAAGTSGHHWLLLRRNRKTGEYAFYRAYSPTRVPLKTLVMVAGRRWTVEESLCATWRRIAIPAELGGIGGAFLGLMVYLDLKGEGDGSMPENRWSGPDGWDDAPGGPHDMAKSILIESQSPGMQTSHPPERRLKPAPHPCIGIEGWPVQPPWCGRYPARVFKEMSGTPKSC